MDVDALDRHGVWALAVISQATSPLDCAIGIVRVSTSPDTKADGHGSLGILSAIDGTWVGDWQSTNDGAIDPPLDCLLGPLDGVIVVVILGRSGHGIPDGAIHDGGVAFAEVIGLDVGLVASNHFPIDLVEIIGFQDDTADNTLAGSNFHVDLDLAPEDVEFGLHGGRLTLLGHGEFGAHVIVVDDSSGGVPATTVCLGKVEHMGLSKSLVGGTGCRVQGIA